MVTRLAVAEAEKYPVATLVLGVVVPACSVLPTQRPVITTGAGDGADGVPVWPELHASARPSRAPIDGPKISCLSDISYSGLTLELSRAA